MAYKKNTTVKKGNTNAKNKKVAGRMSNKAKNQRKNKRRFI